MASAAGFTCIACRIVVSGSDTQRDHYRTDWHRYNVKRQVADLPPISLDLFNEKLSTSNQEANKADTSKGKTKIPAKVDADEEYWSSDDDEMEQLDESQAIPKNHCLFCSVESTSITNNLQHMTMKHGFSIPDHRFCTDVVALVDYLAMKIGAGKYCIDCNKRFVDLNACQKHMRDTNHCHLNAEGENVVELLDFYDYSDALNESDNDVLVDEGAFLVLPSGAKIGHRSLMRYFRQSLKFDTCKHNKLTDRMLLPGSQLKELGWIGVSGHAAVQKARDIRYIKKIADNYRLRCNLKSNKLFKSKGRKDQQ